MQARDPFRRGDQVIARSNRGIELGEVLCEATPQTLAQMDDPPTGNIQRLSTQQDHHESMRIVRLARDEFQTCRRIVAEMQLPMDIVDLEHVFGGERVVIYYISEDRIDFRELVKKLAHEFQTRIEMKQIGVRDEAKLLADYGDCGKPVCCNTHLNQMPPVSMRMAKLQKATLDPSKISGRCGRLKCCLRYEYDTYEELVDAMPPHGSDVVTQLGRGRVIGQEILANQLLLQMEDGRRVMVATSEVLSVLTRSGKGNQEGKGNQDKSKSRAPDDTNLNTPVDASPPENPAAELASDTDTPSLPEIDGNHD